MSAMLSGIIRPTTYGWSSNTSNNRYNNFTKMEDIGDFAWERPEGKFITFQTQVRGEP